MSKTDLSPFKIVRVGDVPFGVTSLDEATRWLISIAAVQRIPINVRLANAYNVALASKDSGYGSLLKDEGVNLPDGTPVVWIMKTLREARRAERVRGPSLFSQTMKQTGTETKHFLLGSTPENLKELEKNLRAMNPDVQISGSYSPPFAPIDDAYIADCARRVSDSDTNLVWVGLGTPKQDVLGTALAKSLNLTTINVGAAFDFVAGSVREAPRWVQTSGFEWLYRLMMEPRRLWRRYIFGNVRFIATVVKYRVIGSRITPR